jgi:DtxR family transcriptional regulator, Mn-dependent transcriptional regulator
MTTLNLSASQEDYLEAIFHIEARKGAARAKDIVERLGVHNSSVTQALRALAEKGLINYAPYDLVTLTEAGRRHASGVVQRHGAVRQFLVDVLGISAELAEADACRLEHSISTEVLARLGELMAYHAANPGQACRWDSARGAFSVGTQGA